MNYCDVAARNLARAMAAELAMKRIKSAYVFFLLFGLVASGTAWAHGASVHHRQFHHHRHAHAGIFIGVPLRWHYPPQQYYYSYPPLIATPATPPVYIERSDVPQAQSPTSNYWWYYCRDPQGYYPYVKQCPTGWQQVPARPPDLDR